MCFCWHQTSLPDTKINSDNNSIIPSTRVKNLGVILDCHLTFDVAIHEMYKKVMGQLLFLNTVKDKFETETIKTVVESIALSVVNYCLPVYGTTNATLQRRVHQLQNFAAKIFAGGARRSAPSTPFITHLKWLKIDKKKEVIFDVAIYVFKVNVNVFPE